MKKLFLVFLFLTAVSASHAGIYFVTDSAVVKNANDQVVQKQIYVYNANHKVASLSTYTLQDGQLKLSTVSNYEYDVYDNYSMLETVVYSQDIAISGSRLIYEYDAKKMLWSKNYVYSNGEWVLITETEYVYDDSDQKIKENYSFYSTIEGYSYQSQTTYEYDNEGRKSVVTELRKSSSEEWENYRQETYQYEDDGLYMSRIDWSYKDGNWEFSSKYNERTNSNGDILMYEHYNYTNGVWIGVAKCENDYTSDFLLKGYILYSFDNGSWAFQDKIEYDYSPSNMTIIRYYKYDKGWQLEHTYYSYFHTEESAIDNIHTDIKFDVSKPCYDIRGTQVNPQDYHGVLIQEGNKFFIWSVNRN